MAEFAIFPMSVAVDTPEWLRPDFGADRAGASQFEILVDAHIRGMLADLDASAIDMAAFETRRDMYMPAGEGRGHYILEPKTGEGTPPIYTGRLKDGNGIYQNIVTLDIRDEYQKMMETQITISALERRMAQQDRAMDFLFSDSEEAQEVWREVTDGIIADEDFETRELMRRIFGAAYGE